MPVRLGPKSSAGDGEARIEIVPLIDIMFFLLAAFMLVSLSMVSLKTVKVNLPTAASATSDSDRDVVNVSVDKDGQIYLNSKPVAAHELVAALKAAIASKPTSRVLISADKDAHHGSVMQALDLVRAAGIEKVAFDTRTAGPGKP